LSAEIFRRCQTWRRCSVGVEQALSPDGKNKQENKKLIEYAMKNNRKRKNMR
jgi:hypothetical protein